MLYLLINKIFHLYFIANQGLLLLNIFVTARKISRSVSLGWHSSSFKFSKFRCIIGTFLPTTNDYKFKNNKEKIIPCLRLGIIFKIFLILEEFPKIISALVWFHKVKKK